MKLLSLPFVGLFACLLCLTNVEAYNGGSAVFVNTPELDNPHTMNHSAGDGYKWEDASKRWAQYGLDRNSRISSVFSMKDNPYCKCAITATAVQSAVEGMKMAFHWENVGATGPLCVRTETGDQSTPHPIVNFYLDGYKCKKR